MVGMRMDVDLFCCTVTECSGWGTERWCGIWSLNAIMDAYVARLSLGSGPIRSPSFWSSRLNGKDCALFISLPPTFILDVGVWLTI